MAVCSDAASMNRDPIAPTAQDLHGNDRTMGHPPIAPEQLLQAVMTALEALGIGFELKRPAQLPEYKSAFLEKCFETKDENACYERYLGRPEACRPCLLARAIASQKIQRATLYDVSGRCFDVTAIPQLGPGEVPWAMEVLQDVTERTRAEQALRESEERFRAMAENTPDLIARFDRDHRYLYANPVSRERVGVTTNELAGKTIRETWLQPEMSQRMELEIDAVFATGENRRVQLLWPNGFWIDCMLVPERAEDGTTRAVIANARDITQLKRTEEALRQRAAALRQSEEMYRMIADNVGDGIWLVDLATLTMDYASPAVLQASGYAVEELSGISLERLMTPESFARVKATLAEVLSQKNGDRNVTRRLELEEVSKTGERRWVEVTARLLFDTHGVAREIVGVTHDVTERRRSLDLLSKAMVEAEAASRIKSQFVSNISHEIRTPLNAIIGLAELIARDSELGSAQSRAGIILHESEVLLALVNDLLDQAKMAEGRFELSPEPTRLSEVLDAVCLGANIAAMRKALTYRIVVAPSVPQAIVCDGLRLRQILQNLVSNAVKFTEKGEVRLEVSCAERSQTHARLHFSVVDTGIGIPLDRQDNIFEAFVQADANTTRRYGGTGLGTTIARHLVQMMGGDITLESQPHRGSHFWFELTFELADEPSIQPPSSSFGRGERNVQSTRRMGSILVAEDYAVNYRIVREHLESAGHRVTIVENGEQAVRACSESVFDLVLMDLQMPVMDGFEATRRIRELPGGNGTVPILAVTASAEARTKNECVKRGMNGVITKPVRRATLLDTIEKWLLHSAGVIDTPIPPSSVIAAQPLPAAPRPLVFGYRDLIEQFGGKERLAQGVAREFSINLAEEQKALRVAFDAGDLEQVRKRAHRLKGGAASVCAFEVSDVAARIETAARDGNATAIPQLLAEFQAAQCEFVLSVSVKCSERG